MAWQAWNPFYRKDENTRYVYGYQFQWTPLHQTAEELESLKFSYDTLGERALNRLDEISPPASSGHIPRNREREKSDEGFVRVTKTDGGGGGEKVGSEKEESKKEEKKKRDLYELLKDNASEGGALGELWDQVNTVPDWVDWDQISRGQDVFYRYGGPALTALAYQSLLGGMAASRVTEVLARTGGFSPNVAKQRMFETTQHILQCTLSLESIQPGGAGFQSTIRVRLLHAAVRRRILALAKSRPSYYSVADYGVPINDLDSIGTISTFSATLVFFGIPRQLIWLRPQEIEDYVALWRLIAYYIGVDSSYFSTPERARAIMESLMVSEIHPSEMSKVLANNIITSLHTQPPAFASRQFLEASARWMNGNQMGDELGMGRPSWYYWALMAGQCAFFWVGSWLKRMSPRMDAHGLKSLRHLLYQNIIHSKTFGLGTETDFAFKYIPSYNLVVPDNGDEMSGLMVKGVERRNLLTLVLGGVFAGGVCWAWTRGLVEVVRW
ncbi:hypothetical protein GLAREA_03616 [Glarea lozoyensis ATCC 20868]|uniref:ER-bound oxygenase mpaB/mpaB'/Rubber oxygenase catalytic domain-containing protein n=1 Tax=Glarea lozoyensis (strain ATCC 20868 / MF5171) TaxID=1116229 RepID=S3D0F4_GLAL2|nr:uncharacterized protein GLAREA_03616 [Glarea lozoyensis ATCC 20868]EPE30649.1 hypothetical protein GLAREA_03616 [Glarea lozoyensis ATCC 20868]